MHSHANFRLQKQSTIYYLQASVNRILYLKVYLHGKLFFCVGISPS
jgi:hypothetical protein